MAILEQDKLIKAEVVNVAQSAALEAPKQNEIGGQFEQAAHWISLALHPFLVAPLAIVLILWLDQKNLSAAVGWAGLCAAFVVVPGLLYLRRKLNQKAYSDSDVSVREHRYGFYLFGLACMSLCFAALIWLKAPVILVACFLAALLAIILAALVTRIWTKVSIHAGMMAGVTVVAFFYSLPLALGLAGGTLLVSWARLVLKRHTLQQTLFGWAIAAVAVLVVVSPILG
jgi:membrane-associated phospholipid phosphatase